MRAVIQRVRQASVIADGFSAGSIGEGLLVLLGIEDADGPEDVDWLSGKLVNLRIFNDSEGVMNVSVKENGGEILLVSQFTLYAAVRKGNRPSYIRASKAAHAVPLYEEMIARLGAELGKPVQTGKFGADMKVSLLNDGPVTLFIDTHNRE